MSHTSRVVDGPEGRYVEIVTPGGEPGYESGRRFYFGGRPVGDLDAAARRRGFESLAAWSEHFFGPRGNDQAAGFRDYEARLALSQRNGHAWGVGVRVQPPEGELARLLELGVVHSSLAEEPQAA